MTRTYMIYAGNTFLGYEYGKTEDAVLDLACKKFGNASNWKIKNYTAKIIYWPEEKTK